MWLAKLFGARQRQVEEDEPARHPVVHIESLRSVARAAPAARAKGVNPTAKKGFDPYNSGAFKRQNAWERVVRR